MLPTHFLALGSQASSAPNNPWFYLPFGSLRTETPIVNQKDPHASENQAEKASKFPAAVKDSYSQLQVVIVQWVVANCFEYTIARLTQPVIIVGTVQQSWWTNRQWWHHHVLSRILTIMKFWWEIQSCQWWYGMGIERGKKQNDDNGGHRPQYQLIWSFIKPTPHHCILLITLLPAKDIHMSLLHISNLVCFC